MRRKHARSFCCQAVYLLKTDIYDRAIYTNHDKTANATFGKFHFLEQFHNALELMN